MSARMQRILGLLVTFIVAAPLVHAEEIRVIGWNVESGDNSPSVITEQIAAFNGYDIWGLCEVREENAQRYADAAEIGEGENADFRHVLGSTGRADRLVIIYDANRFEKVRDFELDELSFENRVRAPLVAEFKLKGTTDENPVRFFFMVNHLYRSNAERRQEQAEKLNAWAAQQQIPTIAVGDYNFDFDLPSGPGNTALTKMTAGGNFAWVRPSVLVKTQASSRFNSVLDFVFVSGAAKNWDPRSTIIVREGDFPDTSDTSDHRPVEGLLETNPRPRQRDVAELKRLILERIQHIERELAELRELAKQLDSEE